MSLAALKGPDKQLNTGHGILILTHTDEEGAGRSIETIVTAAVRVRRAGSLSRDPTSSTPCRAEGGREGGTQAAADGLGPLEAWRSSLGPSVPRPPRRNPRAKNSYRNQQPAGRRTRGNRKEPAQPRKACGGVHAACPPWNRRTDGGARARVPPTTANLREGPKGSANVARLLYAAGTRGGDGTWSTQLGGK